MFNKGIAVAMANLTMDFIQPLNTDHWKLTPDTRLMRLKVSETADECPVQTHLFTAVHEP